MLKGQRARSREEGKGQRKTESNHTYLNTDYKGCDLCRLFKDGECILESYCLGLGTGFTYGLYSKLSSPLCLSFLSSLQYRDNNGTNLRELTRIKKVKICKVLRTLLGTSFFFQLLVILSHLCQKITNNKKDKIRLIYFPSCQLDVAKGLMNFSLNET